MSRYTSITSHFARKDLSAKSTSLYIAIYDLPLLFKLLFSSYLEHCRQLVGGYVDDPVVHELDHGLEVVEVDVLEDDDGVLARVHAEQGLGEGEIDMLISYIVTKRT